jgi:hypothetical protein
MQIDESDEQSINAEISMSKSSEQDANVTVETDRHPLKQYSPISATDEGRQIDESDESA